MGPIINDMTFETGSQSHFQGRYRMAKFMPVKKKRHKWKVVGRRGDHCIDSVCVRCGCELMQYYWEKQYTLDGVVSFRAPNCNG